MSIHSARQTKLSLRNVCGRSKGARGGQSYSFVPCSTRQNVNKETYPRDLPLHPVPCGQKLIQDQAFDKTTATMIHERVRNLGGQPLTGANKQASDLGLAKLELTEYDVENPLQHLPVTAKLVARVDKIRQQYLTSEVWATLRKSIDTALDKNKTIDKVVMLKFGTLAHITDEADAYIEEHFQRLGSTLGIAGQIRARRSGGSGVDGGAPVVQVQSIFYDHQFLPGDGRLLTGLGAKVVEYPDIITYIDHNALVIDNLLDRQLQPEFIIQSNPGILIGGQMERWAGDMQLDLMVKNYPEEQKGEWVCRPCRLVIAARFHDTGPARTYKRWWFLC